MVVVAVDILEGYVCASPSACKPVGYALVVAGCVTALTAKCGSVVGLIEVQTALVVADV